MANRLKEVTKFRATDGREFDDQESAIKHQISIDVQDDEYDASEVSNVDLLEALVITAGLLSYGEGRWSKERIKEVRDNQDKVRIELLKRLLGAPPVKPPAEIKDPTYFRCD